MNKERNIIFQSWLYLVFIALLVPTKANEIAEPVVLNKKNVDLNTLCNNFSKSEFHDPEILFSISSVLLKDGNEMNEKFKAYGYFALAEGQYYSQNFKIALNSYNTALPLFVSIKDSLKIAVTYNTIGIINFILGNDDRACEAYLNGFKIYSDLHNKLGMAQMYHNLALIYWRACNYTKSDYYGLKAMEIYKAIGEKKNLADLYNNYAVSLVKREDYKNGLIYYNRATEIFQELADERGLSSVIFNIGNLYEYQQKFDSANVYYTKAHKVFSANKDTINLINSYQKLAVYDRYLKHYDLAISKLLESEKLNQKIGDMQFTAIINKSLSADFEMIGNFKESLRHNKIYQQYKDSISKEEASTKIAEIESKFLVEQTKKELEISEQNSTAKNFIIIFIVVFFILSAVAFFYYWNNYKIKEEKRVLMLEHKVLRTQMDPHFIFNAMSALQCYIMDDKPEEAIRFLSDFSALLRLVLQYSKTEVIPIAKEKKILDYYLSLQNKRFDDKIRFEISIDQQLLDENVMIPPMLAQPFIENSLEHGGLDLIENAMILVNLKKVNNCIKLSIEDNGIGIEKSLLRVRESAHKSLAIAITHERLKLLNSNQKEKVDLLITDLSRTGSRGTRVEFMIPIT